MTKDELKIFIKDNLVNKNTGKILPQRANKKWLENRNLYNDLINYYTDSESLSESIYRIINDIEIRPTCKICGKTLKYTNNRFAIFCSQSCTNKDPEVLAKNKENVSKALKATYKKCGDEIKEKRAQTLKSLYGINGCSPFMSKEFQNKAKNTIMLHHGVDNIFRLPEYHNKAYESQRQKSIEYQKTLGYDIEYVYDKESNTYNIKVKNCCTIHGDVIMHPSIFNNRTRISRKNYMVLCPICNPLRNSETSIETVIKNFLIENNINYEIHNKTVIKPYELDFYLPDFNLAIECNGIYWHQGEDALVKHHKKFNMCKEQNIQLLYFWEDQILFKSEIIFSILKSKLNLNERIYARNCVIKELSSKEIKEFIFNNHLQGNINAPIKLGLFHKGELVQVMSFGKLHTNNVYELYRFCSKSGITVIGGASKLLKYFIKKFNPNEIITYTDKEISNGNVYTKLGFKQDSETNSSVFYVNSDTFERKNIVDVNSGRITDEIIKELSYFKCYSLGSIKFKLKIG